MIDKLLAVVAQKAVTVTAGVALTSGAAAGTYATQDAIDLNLVNLGQEPVAQETVDSSDTLNTDVTPEADADAADVADAVETPADSADVAGDETDDVDDEADDADDEADDADDEADDADDEADDADDEADDADDEADGAGDEADDAEDEAAD